MLDGSNKSEYIHTLNRSERVSQFKYHNFGHSPTLHLQGKNTERSQSERLKRPSYYMRQNLHRMHKEVVDATINDMNSSEDEFQGQLTSQSLHRENLSGDDYADMEISDESEAQTDSMKRNHVDSPHNGDYEPVQFGCQKHNTVSGLSEDST